MHHALMALMLIEGGKNKVKGTLLEIKNFEKSKIISRFPIIFSTKLSMLESLEHHTIVNLMRLILVVSTSTEPVTCGMPVAMETCQ